MRSDIHWGNVLVTTKSAPIDPGPILEQEEVLVADLGEAQLISSQSHGRTYYGNEAFWAPEVKRYHRHSTASDVFAVGRLFLEMTMVHWDFRASSDCGTRSREMPLRLLSVMNLAMEEDAEIRPTAEDITLELENLAYGDIGVKYQGRELEFIDYDQYCDTAILSAAREEPAESGKYGDIVV